MFDKNRWLNVNMQITDSSQDIHDKSLGLETLISVQASGNQIIQMDVIKTEEMWKNFTAIANERLGKKGTNNGNTILCKVKRNNKQKKNHLERSKNSA